MSGLGPSVDDLIAAFQELTEVIKGATEAKSDEAEETKKTTRESKKRRDYVREASNSVKGGLKSFGAEAAAGALFDPISAQDAARQAALQTIPLLGRAAAPVVDAQDATQARVNATLGGFAAMGAEISDAELESITSTIAQQEVRRGQFERRVRRQVLKETPTFEEGAADVPFAVAASRTATDIGKIATGNADDTAIVQWLGDVAYRFTKKLGIKVW